MSRLVFGKRSDRGTGSAEPPTGGASLNLRSLSISSADSLECTDSRSESESRNGNARGGSSDSDRIRFFSFFH